MLCGRSSDEDVDLSSSSCWLSELAEKKPGWTESIPFFFFVHLNNVVEISYMKCFPFFLILILELRNSCNSDRNRLSHWAHGVGEIRESTARRRFQTLKLEKVTSVLSNRALSLASPYQQHAKIGCTTASSNS